jgi:hypothetical protein
MRPAIRSSVLVGCALVLAVGASADLAPWDQAKVTDLAKQLAAVTAELSDSFRKQPVPAKGSPQRQSHFLLTRQLRDIRRGAQALSTALQNGGDRKATLARYQSLMQRVRTARDHARRITAGTEVEQKADAARDILNQLAPFYDAKATPMEPVRR